VPRNTQPAATSQSHPKTFRFDARLNEDQKRLIQRAAPPPLPPLNSACVSLRTSCIIYFRGVLDDTKEGRRD
jgi:hypothetical protein